MSAFAAARDAYKFFFQHFWKILRLILLPVIAAGLVLYIALSGYLAELISFLKTPNSRTASLALGTLAAGLFVSLFCYAVAVSATCDLALGKPRSTGLCVKVERQEWRIYAAYMRLLLLLSAVLVLGLATSNYIAPLFFIPDSFSTPAITVAIGVVTVWLFARIGFLIAPIVSVSEGVVLRKALKQGAGDLLRNSILLGLLVAPGVFLLVAGGYVLRMDAGALRVGGTLPLVDSARSMQQVLGTLLTLTSLALFITIVLLSVGGVAAYQTNAVGGADGTSSNSRRSVLAEKLPK
jgi:hypothetical protein